MNSLCKDSNNNKRNERKTLTKLWIKLFIYNNSLTWEAQWEHPIFLDCMIVLNLSLPSDLTQLGYNLCLLKIGHLNSWLLLWCLTSFYLRSDPRIALSIRDTFWKSQSFRPLGMYLILRTLHSKTPLSRKQNKENITFLTKWLFSYLIVLKLKLLP